MYINHYKYLKLNDAACAIKILATCSVSSKTLASSIH